MLIYLYQSRFSISESWNKTPFIYFLNHYGMSLVDHTQHTLIPVRSLECIRPIAGLHFPVRIYSFRLVTVQCERDGISWTRKSIDLIAYYSILLVNRYVNSWIIYLLIKVVVLSWFMQRFIAFDWKSPLLLRLLFWHASSSVDSKKTLEPFPREAGSLAWGVSSRVQVHNSAHGIAGKAFEQPVSHTLLREISYIGSTDDPRPCVRSKGRRNGYSRRRALQ